MEKWCCGVAEGCERIHTHQWAKGRCDAWLVNKPDACPRVTGLIRLTLCYLITGLLLRSLWRRVTVELVLKPMRKLFVSVKVWCLSQWANWSCQCQRPIYRPGVFTKTQRQCDMISDVPVNTIGMQIWDWALPWKNTNTKTVKRTWLFQISQWLLHYFSMNTIQLTKTILLSNKVQFPPQSLHVQALSERPCVIDQGPSTGVVQTWSRN